MPAYEEVTNPKREDVVKEQPRIEANAGEYGGTRLSLQHASNSKGVQRSRHQ